MTDYIRAIKVPGLLTARGDPGKFFAKAKAAGVNTVCFFLNALEDSDEHPPLIPFCNSIGTWNPGKLAGEPAYDHDFPMFDVGTISSAFRLRLMVLATYCVESGMAPWLVFDDRCSQPDQAQTGETIDEWKSLNDPWVCNTLRFPGWAQGDTSHTGSGGNKDPRLNPYREALERDVYQIFHDAGCPVIYGEPENETGWWETPAFTIQMQLDWYEARAAHLKSLGFKVVGSARPPITTMISPLVDIYNYHGVKLPTDIPSTISPANLPDSDGADGAGQAISAWGGHSLSVAECSALIPNAKLTAGFDYLPQEAWDSKTLPQNVDAISDESWAAMLAMNTGLGYVAPTPQPQPDPNPQPPIPPPTPPVPPAPPTPVKHGFWFYIFHGNFKKAFKILFGG
jgi:hypothetical protein